MVGEIDQSSDYAYVNGKKLRKGYTTGTCATAASVAAAQMILEQDLVERVLVRTASGQDVWMQVEDAWFDGDRARAAIRKDGGDDADATHGLLIYAYFRLDRKNTPITIEGGIGVGRITQKGMPLAVGMAAINPTPRRMIEESLRSLLGSDFGGHVEIVVPEGEEVAKLTYNSRLGIEGGISILGTTGIVNPMSEDSWKAAISLELSMLYQQGYRSVVLVPGNYGEAFVRKHFSISPHLIVNMSNFVGHILKEVQRIGFTKVLLVGHMGKFVKIAAGVFSTHSKDADARMETLVANLALLGAPLPLLREIDACLTTEAAGDLIEQAGYQHLYQVLVDKIQQRCLRLVKNRKPEVQIDVVLFASRTGYLASTEPLEYLQKEWQ
ncbi:cobalt-precorrin-5B (C(1))-methyltransferase [Streptococcus danieliae]|uniref:Cobalt-precorrin-5B C(1)-methyltransferase n=1 Tax=Streptococcus danieliae TaxID=747656 RepID=A0A7X3KC07_9STRE|nr:cobalt-precorrin-5B (C(1))-methyltransferase CbiD [Streptococcus danieliae]MVX58103.1 cobalt-precorrin-5B (C(1))-methyltransferase [Streptococcus danieliae]